MENFKIDIYKSENSNAAFPDFQKQSEENCLLFKMLFSKKVGLNENEIDSIQILKLIGEKSKLLSNINAESENFDFKLLLKELQILEPEHVNINWYKFNDIDKFKLVDFSNNLRFIWYPGPDDIQIFPDNISWIISIDESGYI